MRPLFRCRFLSFFHNGRHCCSSSSSCSSRFFRPPARISSGDPHRPFVIETGQLARFADGCTTAAIGDSAVSSRKWVLATVVGSGTSSSSSGILPLTVDYRQRQAAIGRIPTNFLRRDVGRTDREILACRAVDRSVRPLFPIGYSIETQIVCSLLALDDSFDPVVLAINASSAALAVSDLPWNGPIAAVQVHLVDGEVVVNGRKNECKDSSLSMIISGLSDNRLTMFEMEGRQSSFEDVRRCLLAGLAEIDRISQSIVQLAIRVGRPKRPLEQSSDGDGNGDELRMAVSSMAEMRIEHELTDSNHDKTSRDKAIRLIREDILPALEADFRGKFDRVLFDGVFSSLTKRVFRDLILDQNFRCDGRTLEELRPIECKIDLYKRLHGSALFQRGQTQVMATVALDSLNSAFRSDALSVLLGAPERKTFILHYDFPNYAVNEVGRVGGLTSRREIGHGALAEKALKAVIPGDFPFTIRLTCEVLESNGSSSMASICAGSLALFDAGVQLKAPMAGVAVGLVSRHDSYRILTDILGIEDYAGDMDFKIAGTAHGFTAMQLDMKVPGLPSFIVLEALQQGGRGLNRVLSIMSDTKSSANASLKPHGPVTEQLVIPPHKRQQFLGIGGHNVRTIEAETGVRITQMDDITFHIFATHPQAMSDAKEMVNRLTCDSTEPDLDFGGIYRARIVEIRDNVVLLVLKEGMKPISMPNSHLDSKKVQHASVLGFEVGQEISVKYFGRDGEGRHRVSRKMLLITEMGARNMLDRK